MPGQGQLTLDLFGEARPTPRESFLKWGREWGLTPDAESAVNQVFDDCERLGIKTAYERCKILLHGMSVEDARVYGLFDYTLPYHVLWDRNWAHKCGVDHELIPLVFHCDYDTRQPTFYDKDGKPLQTVTKPQVVRKVG